MAKFRIATPRGASFTTAGDYGYEMEALTPIDAEIFEVPSGSEDDFVNAARDADALYAKGRPITKRMIDGLQRCKIIALGSVGVDSVDVEAATQKGIPVTNCPDTFIDEVADHAMTLILATFRRLTVQDKLVRDGALVRGPADAVEDPAPDGADLGPRLLPAMSRASRNGQSPSACTSSPTTRSSRSWWRSSTGSSR